MVPSVSARLVKRCPSIFVVEVKSNNQKDAGACCVIYELVAGVVVYNGVIALSVLCQINNHNIYMAD